MNDLDLVRAVLDEVPEPAPARLAAGRARLIAAAAEPAARRGTSWTARRLLLPASFTVAAAAAMAAVLVAVLAGGPAVDGSPRAGAGTAQSADLMAEVLAAAARAVASEPVTEPKPGQWIFDRVVEARTGQRAQASDSWITFNGIKSAYLEPGGQLSAITEDPLPNGTRPGPGALAAFDHHITPMTAYNALAALPASPAALLAAVDAELARTGETFFGVAGWATAKPQREFAWLGQLLWNAAFFGAPPSALAAVYRAIAMIPGVAVNQRVTDAAGQSTIGIIDTLAQADDRAQTAFQGQNEILLNPATYQPVGLIWRYLADNFKPADGWLTDSLAIVQVAEVSGPGQR
jgi:hypothetical protein